MGKKAFVFSGQGSQTMGMGSELFSAFKETANVVKGGKKQGVDVLKLCLETPDEELSLTINAQPAIFSLSMAVFEILKSNGITADGFAGFSLGECSALTASGVLSLEDGFFLIKERAAAMQKAAETVKGAMYAIIGLDINILKQLCEETDGFCTPVNFNCSNQTVIAGEEEAAKAVAEKAVTAKAMKVVKLSVNSAFHTHLMENAANEFKEKINNLNFKAPSAPLYSNLSGTALSSKINIPDYLAKQMTNAVLWQSAVENMIKDGYDTFVELGPGKTLTGLIKRIDKTVKTFNITDEKSANEAIEQLKI